MRQAILWTIRSTLDPGDSVTPEGLRPGDGSADLSSSSRDAPSWSISPALTRGIFRHGIAKTFLTRGLFGSLFRPLLYTRADLVQWYFMEVVTGWAAALPHVVSKAAQLPGSLWFVLGPSQLFETLLCSSDHAGPLVQVPVLQNAVDVRRGRDCATLSLGYLLWHLEQLLENSSEFASALRWPTAQVQEVVRSLPSGAPAIQALERFRSLFSPGGAVPDPRNWMNAYVLEVGSTLLPSTDAFEALWAGYPDCLASLQLAAFHADFFSQLKETTLRLAPSAVGA